MSEKVLFATNRIKAPTQADTVIIKSRNLKLKEVYLVMKKKESVYKKPLTIINLFPPLIAQSIEFQCSLLEKIDSFDMRVFKGVMIQHTFSTYLDRGLMVNLVELASDVFSDVSEVDYDTLMERIEKLKKITFSLHVKNGGDWSVGTFKLFEDVEIKESPGGYVRLRVSLELLTGLRKRYINSKYERQLKGQDLSLQLAHYLFELRLNEAPKSIDHENLNLRPLRKEDLRHRISISKNFNLHKKPVTQALETLKEQGICISDFDIKGGTFYVKFLPFTDKEKQEISTFD